MSGYRLYSDEAWTHNPRLRFWRFYGGALVKSSDRERVENALLALKNELGLQGEIKWSEARQFNSDRIAVVVERFLQFVESGDVKFRYMWIDNGFQNPEALTPYHEEWGFYILYYYFVVQGFGLPWHDENGAVEVELFPDQLPDNVDKRRAFREFLMRAHTFQRYETGSQFRISEVADDVKSGHHIILQCVDFIIGAIGYRLNDRHRVKQNNGRRSDGTRRKEGLYKGIYRALRKIDMGERGTLAYSIGHSTGKGGEWANLWRHKFRQWDFRGPGAFNPDWLRN